MHDEDEFTAYDEQGNADQKLSYVASLVVAVRQRQYTDDDVTDPLPGQ